jgi:hypothetical protein
MMGSGGLRFRTALAVTAVAAVTVLAGAGQKNPFVAQAADGHRVHILPPPAVVRGPSNMSPLNAVPSSDAAVYGGWQGTGLLLDHGGPEMSNAGVQVVYWNSGVSDATQTSMGFPTIKDQIDAFVGAFGGNVNWSDSPSDDYPIVQQYGTTKSISPALRNLGFLLDTQSTATTIDDAAIRAYLAGLFAGGRLSASTSVVYSVFFPPGMEVTAGSDASCSAFCGYHSYFTYQGLPIKYAVFPFLNSACAGCSLPGKSVADMLTIVMSHEVREAVTDPQFDAWFDSTFPSGYEADDKCAWQHLYMMSNGGFWVQPEFSNGGTVTASGFTANYAGPGCIVPAVSSAGAPVITSQPLNRTILQGQTTTLSVAATGTAPLSYQWYVGTSGTTTSPIGGAASAGYTTPPLSSTTSYWVRISNADGTANSATATVTVEAPPTITMQPTHRTVPITQNAHFTVAANAMPAPAYGWQVSADAGASWTTLMDTPPYTGTSTSILTIVNATANLNGDQYRCMVTNNTGLATSDSATLRVIPRPTVPADYDNDGRADLSVYRPSAGEWFVLQSHSDYSYANYLDLQWGLPGDVPVAGDFDGDGQADLAVWRPSNGTWYIRFSSDGYSYGTWKSYQWGLPGDIPVLADLDGDRKSDLVVFRPSNGTWYALFSSDGYSYGTWKGIQWGLPGDEPVATDFDGDGRTDLVVFRPSNGTWYLLFSSDNYSYATWTSHQWGLPDDTPVAADLDGDGKADLVVYRPANGSWYVRFSSSLYSYATWTSYQWGAYGDIPMPNDFDGDGQTDLAFWRPSTGEWFVRYSSGGYSYSTSQSHQWGLTGDVPLGKK